MTFAAHWHHDAATYPPSLNMKFSNAATVTCLSNFKLKMALCQFASIAAQKETKASNDNNQHDFDQVRPYYIIIIIPQTIALLPFYRGIPIPPERGSIQPFQS